MPTRQPHAAFRAGDGASHPALRAGDGAPHPALRATFSLKGRRGGWMTILWTLAPLIRRFAPPSPPWGEGEVGCRSCGRWRPSSGASRHLLPPGEKGRKKRRFAAQAPLIRRFAPPSPPRGEGEECSARPALAVADPAPPGGGTPQLLLPPTEGGSCCAGSSRFVVLGLAPQGPRTPPWRAEWPRRRRFPGSRPC